MPNIIRAKLDEAIKWLFATTAKPWDVPVVPMSPKAEPKAVAAKHEPEAIGPTTIIDFAQKRPCTVAGCERPHHARGLCSRHYTQSRRAKAA